MLYVSAKVSQFALLPQGQVEAKDRVLNMVNKMDELDTSKINPLTHPIENTQTLREDIEKKDIEREKLQELSKEKDSGFYLTPKVIE